MEHVVLLWFAFILVGVPNHVTATCDDVKDCVRKKPHLTDTTTKAAIIQYCAAFSQFDDCLKAALPACSDTSVTSPYASGLDADRYLCSAAEHHGEYAVCIDREYGSSMERRCPSNSSVTPVCLQADEQVNCFCDVIVPTCGQAAATFFTTYVIKYVQHLYNCSSLTACGGATTARSAASLAQATLGGLVVPSLLLMLLRWQ